MQRCRGDGVDMPGMHRLAAYVSGRTAANRGCRPILLKNSRNSLSTWVAPNGSDGDWERP